MRTSGFRRHRRRHKDLLDADGHARKQTGKFEVTMDMPNVQKEDANISVDDQSNTLTVTTERKEQPDKNEAGWVTREEVLGQVCALHGTA
jgi:HSP20 family molecular chaperone IbpA